MQNKIRFIDSSHKYIDSEDRELISVSVFTEKFKEKVDWIAIAKKYAKKETLKGNNITYKEVLNKWDDKKNKSAKVGTLYHSIREQELINDPNLKCSLKQCSFDSEYKYSIPINSLENNTIYPELMIYDIDHMICGQSDKVEVVDNQINVIDYKTDLEIKFKAFSSEWVKPRKLLPPLSHLDDCNGNIYSIKMSLYMYFLWKSNKGKLKPGNIILEHISLKRDPDNDNIPILKDGKPVVESIKKIILPYRKREVEEMLKYDRQK